jgi:cell division transport system permease protein
MKPISLLRVVKFAFQDFFRNFWLSLATISVLVLTLISVNVLVSINVLGKVALETVKSRVDISVHFKPEVEEGRIQTVKTVLMSLPEVKDVEYVAPSKVLENFTKMYEQDAAVVEAMNEVGENPFGASLVIQARDIKGYPQILSALDESSFSQIIEGRDFDDRQAMMGRIQAVSDRIELGIIFVSALFGLITLLIVFNTIRMSIYTHREEIGIMRLVGASNGFIRGPYYIEAVLWGLGAAAVTAAFVWPALAFSQPYVENFFGDVSVDLAGFYSANLVNLIGAQVIGVIALSLVTTKMATARYLKV